MTTIRTKLWVGVGAFVLAGSQVDPATQALDVGVPAAAAASKHGEGGEGGEGGESGRRAPKTRAEAQQKRLVDLALVEGHLDVGVRLYDSGDAAAARTHMKHVSAYRVQGMGPSSKAVVDAITRGRPAADVDQAYARARSDLDAARSKLALDTRTQIGVIGDLVRTAADEYKEGVEHGRIVNATEYQDASGFVSVARRLATRMQPTRAADADAVNTVRQILDGLKDAWPGLGGNVTPTIDASALYGAASKIDLVRSSMKP